MRLNKGRFYSLAFIQKAKWIGENSNATYTTSTFKIKQHSWYNYYSQISPCESRPDSPFWQHYDSY